MNTRIEKVTALNEVQYRKLIVNHLREVFKEEPLSENARKAFEIFAEEYPQAGSVSKSINVVATDLHNSSIATVLYWITAAKINVQKEWERIGLLGRLVYRDYNKQLAWLTELEVAAKSATL
jgi:hypothetical protein